MKTKKYERLLEAASRLRGLYPSWRDDPQPDDLQAWRELDKAMESSRRDIAELRGDGDDGKLTREQRFNAIYDVLVKCGASESYRSSFLHHMKNGCDQFRIVGSLGFGCKYWPERNQINYYAEDRSESGDELQDKINEALAKIPEATE